MKKTGIYLILVIFSIGLIGCTATTKKTESKNLKQDNKDNQIAEGEMLKNSSFNEEIKTAETTTDNWYFHLNSGGQGEYKIEDGVIEITSTNPDAEAHGVQLIQKPVNIEELGLYKVTFKAKAEKERDITLKIGGGADRGWAAYHTEDITLSTDMKEYEIDFKMKDETDPEARFELWFTEDTPKVWMEDISLVKTGVGEPSGVDTVYPGTNAIKNGNFITGESKWNTYVDESADAEIVFEEAKVKANIKDQGPENWSVHLEQGTFTLEKNKEYRISFDAKSTVPRNVGLILENESDYTKYLSGELPLTNEMQTFEAVFTMEGETDPETHLVIAMGNMGEKLSEDHEVIIDNISIKREIGELVWSEEFDYEGLPDPEKWNYTVGGKLFNNEYQYYTDGDLDNAYVKDGKLTIEAIKEDYRNCEYTSARITSAGKGDLLYGRVEVRAKLPGGSGTWPAIWMMPTDSVYGNWPASGEIDIMEYVGNDSENVHASTHCLDYNFMKGNNYTEKLEVENVDKDFNVYAMEWLPGQIDMYFNNKLYFSIKDDGKGWEKWPYDQRFFMILNLAVGGDWGAAEGFDPDTWPQTLEVDYVRMYDLNVDPTNDNQAPTSPGEIKAKPSGYMIPLEWEPATDNFSVAKYEIFMNDKKLAETKKSNYIVKDVKEEENYSFKIRAVDYAGNKSDFVNKDIKTTKLSPLKLPGKIKASEYDLMYGVQTEKTADDDGGENVGWIDKGDWMEYLVEIPESGNYTVDYRLASAPGGGKLELRSEEGKVYDKKDVPITEDWQNWETVKSEGIYLEKGVQVLRVYAIDGGFNLNWLKIEK
ncbi:MAG: carbohydrate binding domain-containing protein [Fusobacteriota bacterium]